jgi:hypothetical protein
MDNNIYVSNELDDIGGLVGHNNGGTITNSNMNGNITAPESHVVGGIVGYNSNSYDGDIGTIRNSAFTGELVGNGTHQFYSYEGIGGLVGINKGDVTDSASTGSITGESYVGGLVGLNMRDANINNSYSTGNVTGNNNRVGGLVGNSHGYIYESYSTGDVDGRLYIGGLVGHNNYYGKISESFATGSVSGEKEVGGLTGEIAGVSLFDDYSESEIGYIKNSYATGSVSGEEEVGGLTGGVYNDGIIENTYATGSVSGNVDVGGLTGSYGEGNSSYWDTEATGQSTSANSDDTGLTTSEMQGSSADGNMNFDFTSTWSTVEGDYPELQWQE